MLVLNLLDQVVVLACVVGLCCSCVFFYFFKQRLPCVVVVLNCWVNMHGFILNIREVNIDIVDVMNDCVYSLLNRLDGRCRGRVRRCAVGTMESTIWIRC